MAVALTALCAAQVANVAADSRLKTPISIKLKIAQLPSALKQISKLVGVTLTNVQTINDLKVTVFVKDMPAGLVLEKVASVLGCEWKADGDLFRLVVDPVERLRRDRYIDAEETAARKEIEDEVSAIAQLSALNPATIDDEIRQQVAAQQAHSTTSGDYDPQRLALLRRATNPQDVTAGRFLAGLDGAKVNAFWRGDEVVGSSAQPQAAGEVADSAAGTGFGQSRRARRPPQGLPIFAQFDPLLYQVQIATRGSVRTVAKRPAHLVTEFAPTGKLAAMPFGKEVLAWDQPVPLTGDWSQIVLAGVDAPAKNSGRLLSVADYLELAFDQTGIPVVVDGFRAPTESRDLNHGIGPFIAWLSVLKQSNHLFTRFEDGFVMARHGGFWRLRKFETPEELLTPLEAKAAKGNPTLDDYAALVAKLTPEQTRPFTIPHGTVVKFDTVPLETAMPALQFYASLDSGALTSALRDGLSFAQMGAAQRQVFEQAALEGVFLGAASTTFGVTLMRMANLGDTRGLGFLVKRDSVPVGGVLTDGQALLFGASLSEATIYKVALSR
jgi:hypothetical protein